MGDSDSSLDLETSDNYSCHQFPFFCFSRDRSLICNLPPTSGSQTGHLRFSSVDLFKGSGPRLSRWALSHPTPCQKAQERQDVNSALLSPIGLWRWTGLCLQRTSSSHRTCTPEGKPKGTRSEHVSGSWIELRSHPVACCRRGRAGSGGGTGKSPHNVFNSCLLISGTPK